MSLSYQDYSDPSSSFSNCFLTIRWPLCYIHLLYLFSALLLLLLPASQIRVLGTSGIKSAAGIVQASIFLQTLCFIGFNVDRGVRYFYFMQKFIQDFLLVFLSWKYLVNIASLNRFEKILNLTAAFSVMAILGMLITIQVYQSKQLCLQGEQVWVNLVGVIISIVLWTTAYAVNNKSKKLQISLLSQGYQQQNFSKVRRERTCLWLLVNSQLLSQIIQILRSLFANSVHSCRFSSSTWMDFLLCTAYLIMSFYQRIYLSWWMYRGEKRREEREQIKVQVESGGLDFKQIQPQL